MNTYLGLDLGTSGVKALLMDENQVILGSGSATIEVSRPNEGWSEQDPADWVSATTKAILALGKDHDLSTVRGIGLSGHMHGATVLDADDQPLRPCILWNDTRSHVEAAALDANPIFRDLTGNIVFPGFTAPKLVWLAKREPELFGKITKVLLPKDYLRLWLTGEHISEMSDSAGTAWLDVAKREWSDALLEATGMRRDQMPALVEGTEVGGHLLAGVAGELGLPAGIPVAGGGGDNAASAVGLGAVRDGVAFASLGTSGVVFVANGSYAPNADSAVHTFCHALPDTWHQMGVILSATDCLNWFAGITDKTPPELTGEIGDQVRVPGPVIFLPYLSGERTPHNDADIRGQFLNLSHLTDRADMTRAILEAVAFAFRDCLEALAVAGTKLDRVMAVGGGSSSAYWLQVLADVLEMPVDLPKDGDFGAAFGAARFGLIAATGAKPEEICTQPEIEQTYLPDAGRVAAFSAQYQKYRAAYPALKALNKLS
ncbi:MAG: xylulokinase [Paracoccaceae bacterium]